jgi:hypothetical protein
MRGRTVNGTVYGSGAHSCLLCDGGARHGHPGFGFAAPGFAQSAAPRELAGANRCHRNYPA